jgi:hypothetical protein
MLKHWTFPITDGDRRCAKSPNTFAVSGIRSRNTRKTYKESKGINCEDGVQVVVHVKS